MMILTIAAALAATATPATQVRLVGKVDRQILIDALAAPETPRAAGEGPRFCVVDDLTKKGAGRRVCRSRREWVRHGVYPLAG